MSGARLVTSDGRRYLAADGARRLSNGDPSCCDCCCKLSCPDIADLMPYIPCLLSVAISNVCPCECFSVTNPAEYQAPSVSTVRFRPLLSTFVNGDYLLRPRIIGTPCPHYSTIFVGGDVAAFSPATQEQCSCNNYLTPDYACYDIPPDSEPTYYATYGMGLYVWFEDVGGVLTAKALISGRLFTYQCFGGARTGLTDFGPIIAFKGSAALPEDWTDDCGRVIGADVVITNDYTDDGECQTIQAVTDDISQEATIIGYAGEITIGANVVAPDSVACPSYVIECAGYRQARSCADNTLVDEFALAEEIVVMNATYRTEASGCIYFNINEPTTLTPGTIMTPTAGPYSGCHLCGFRQARSCATGELVDAWAASEDVYDGMNETAYFTDEFGCVYFTILDTPAAIPGTMITVVGEPYATCAECPTECPSDCSGCPATKTVVVSGGTSIDGTYILDKTGCSWLYSSGGLSINLYCNIFGGLSGSWDIEFTGPCEINARNDGLGACPSNGTYASVSFNSCGGSAVVTVS